MIWTIIQRLLIAGLVSLTQLLFTSNTAAQEQSRESSKKYSRLKKVENLGLKHLSEGAIPLDINKLLREGSANQFKIIYGNDDRHEALDYHDAFYREQSFAVAGRINKNRIQPASDNPDFLTFFHKSAAKAYDLCEDVRFSEQSVLPKCTGFLVAPDILVTAGHCVASEYDCEKYQWSFDFYEETKELHKDFNFSCKKIITQKWESSKYKLEDYAVIQLDRFMESAPMLKIRKEGRVKKGTELVAIGHPSGLPKKITDGAQVKRPNKNEMMYTMLRIAGLEIKIPRPIRSALRKRYYFVANFDTFAGNSGSPVFNKETGIVEGILVEGGTDYIYDEEMFCNKENVVKDSAWKAEERIFRINKIPNIHSIINDSFKRYENAN